MSVQDQNEDNFLGFAKASRFVFGNKEFPISLSDHKKQRVEASQKHLYSFLDKRVPIYGVNTGFGDSLFRFIPIEESRQLQNNLVSYLMCGTGKKLSAAASKATLLFRLQSLSQGYSGVSWNLIEKLRLFLDRNWSPVIPCQGSLGASGDLVPLAYIGAMLRGEGEVHTPNGIQKAETLFREFSITPYTLEPKEGLALVNGTSVMCGVALVNLQEAYGLMELAMTGTAWLTLALGGRREAFGTLVNEKAKRHPGQTEVARKILAVLDAENYQTLKLDSISVRDSYTTSFIQDKYSLRCTPQILGPVLETLNLAVAWLETEVNGVSDNPLVDENGELATGGNFYGGYVSHGMDYLKICLGHMADLLDRQTLYIIDEKSNRGLPPNLANWEGIPEKERFLHHGLKGLHQSVSAITSEIMAKTIPNGIFSRSSESHNQDKVSLGTSAAIQCTEVLDSLFTVTSLYLITMAQALDLRGIKLQGKSSELFDQVRKHVPFVERDQALGTQIEALTEDLRSSAQKLEIEIGYNTTHD